MYKTLKLKPGVDREGTNYSNEGTYYATNKVRFRAGYPEKLGGWVRYTANQFTGTARALINWISLAGLNYLGLGTHLKYMIEVSGTFLDVTPIRSTTAAGDVTFAAANGSAVITATDTNHGAVTNDYVTFSGAVSLGGLITAAVLNQEYQITVINGSSYTFTATATANASDTGNGGGAVVGAYQINTGLDVYVIGAGWGAGTYGRGGYGSAATVSVGSQLRLWSHDNFGEDLIACVRGGGVYYWDTTALGRMVALTALPGASQAPTQVNVVMVSDNDRHVICIGADQLGGSGAFDPLLIRWSDAEDAANWQPTATNSAGDLRMQNGSYVVAALQTRQEILIWTDQTVYSLQYVDAPLTFGLNILGDSHGIISPNAAVTADGVVYWMAQDRFYTYTGQISPLMSTVWSHVFKNINTYQTFQVFAATNYKYNEVWWFYCSTDSDTIDSYVIYNYIDTTWAYGTLARTAWLDSPLRPYPMATDYNNRILYHEASADDESGATPVAITSFIESADFDIDDGDHFSFVDKMIPDIDFSESTTATPSVEITLYPRNFPGAAQGSSTAKTVTATAISPESLYTNEVYVRVRGRQLAFRITSNTLGTWWQLGVPRLNIRVDGRKS